jgi:hypothetical protein
VNVKLKNISEHSLDNTKKGSGDIPTVLGNSPIPPKQIMTGLAVVLGIFFFFNLVSSLSEPQFEAEPTEKADVEAQIYPENNRKVEAISLSPNDVEKKLPTSSETTETLQENVKKKP